MFAFLLLIGNAGPAAALTQDQQRLVDEKADAILTTAKDLIGQAVYGYYNVNVTPMRMGCGGYVYYVFLQNGIDLGTLNNNIQSELGEYVAKNDLQKGDLVFFDANKTDQNPTTHVGIYYGNNKIIHMASEELDIVISDLSGSYYTKNYYTARRVIPTYLLPQNSTPAGSIVETAESLMGIAKYGSYNETKLTFNSPEFVYYVCKENGVDLGTKYSNQQARLGQPVSKDKLQPGDLLFFAITPGGNITSRSLVGIYSGSNEFVVCSYINPKTGEGVVKGNLSDAKYSSKFVTARRVL
ncbi:C40 family peptidase [Sporotomaculum syntrophicum]|uniref:C40 family peptidase n=1 Tax=Sporotomaculum syntrophicum TaxID=182264 RepID=UPI00137B0994|nr:NlpC/P60 family protein [Sporotomaculum syntrophicum]